MKNRSQFRSSRAKEILQSHGLRTIDDVFEAGSAVDEAFSFRATRHEHKEVVRMSIDVDGVMETFYIKRQWKRLRRLPRWTEVRRGIGFCSTAESEWKGLQLMSESGINAVEPWAMYHGPKGRCAIITRAAPVESSLEDLLSTGASQQYSEQSRTRLIDSIRNTVLLIKEKRLAWRSMKTKHFYPQAIGDEWRMWLIDCEAVTSGGKRRDWDRCRRDFRQSLELSADDELATRMNAILL